MPTTLADHAPFDTAIPSLAAQPRRRGMNARDTGAATSFDYDETLDKIIASAQKFNAERIKQEDVAKAGGGPPDEE